MITVSVPGVGTLTCDRKEDHVPDAAWLKKVMHDSLVHLGEGGWVFLPREETPERGYLWIFSPDQNNLEWAEIAARVF